MIARTSSSTWVRGVVEMFATEGIDVEALFRDARLNIAVLLDPAGRFSIDDGQPALGNGGSPLRQRDARAVARARPHLRQARRRRPRDDGLPDPARCAGAAGTLHGRGEQRRDLRVGPSGRGLLVRAWSSWRGAAGAEATGRVRDADDAGVLQLDHWSQASDPRGRVCVPGAGRRQAASRGLRVPGSTSAAPPTGPSCANAIWTCRCRRAIPAWRRCMPAWSRSSSNASRSRRRAIRSVCSWRSAWRRPSLVARTSPKR